MPRKKRRWSTGTRGDRQGRFGGQITLAMIFEKPSTPANPRVVPGSGPCAKAWGANHHARARHRHPSFVRGLKTIAYNRLLPWLSRYTVTVRTIHLMRNNTGRVEASSRWPSTQDRAGDQRSQPKRITLPSLNGDVNGPTEDASPDPSHPGQGQSSPCVGDATTWPTNLGSMPPCQFRLLAAGPACPTRADAPPPDVLGLAEKIIRISRITTCHEPRIPSLPFGLTCRVHNQDCIKHRFFLWGRLLMPHPLSRPWPPATTVCWPVTRSNQRFDERRPNRTHPSLHCLPARIRG